MLTKLGGRGDRMDPIFLSTRQQVQKILVGPDESGYGTCLMVHFKFFQMEARRNWKKAMRKAMLMSRLTTSKAIDPGIHSPPPPPVEME